MAVFQFYGTTTVKSGAQYGFTFEHPAETVDQISAELREDKFLTVDRLKAVPDGKGGFIVTGRERAIIGLGNIGTITTAAYRYWEASPEAA